MRAGDLRTNLKVRTTRTINIDGLRIPGGRELTVKRVEQGKAVVMFHGQEVSLQPNDLEVAP